ncbi:MAG TPA: substrate-binding domain-containing protein [Mucilaginibacter sp.]|jgi:phosphate transport system substrate-binding protein
MRSNLRLIGFCAALLLFLQSCIHKVDTAKIESFTSDSAKIAVDESFRPIVDEELYIFKALHDEVHPTVLYAPEDQAINLLMNDSARVAIISRDLTPQEYAQLESRNLRPMTNRFAIDAITLIVNQASNDTMMTVSEIKKMLNGNTKTDKNIVFDNPNSGLVRYLKEFSGNKELKQKNIYSLKSNKEVIKYVSQHPDAIGITDFSWLNDPDKDYADDVEKVKIVNVKDDITKNAPPQYFSPSQTTLALKQYPLVRNLYILNFTGFHGLGMKFATFLAGDRGQRIILKSGLLPDSIPQRVIMIEKKIKQ